MTPDPATKAILEVLSYVSHYVRALSIGENRLSDRHLFDLMDAIHNIPVVLLYQDSSYTPHRVRDLDFASYDAKWSNAGGLSLVKMFDDAIEHAK